MTWDILLNQHVVTERCGGHAKGGCFASAAVKVRSPRSQRSCLLLILFWELWCIHAVRHHTLFGNKTRISLHFWQSTQMLLLGATRQTTHLSIFTNIQRKESFCYTTFFVEHLRLTNNMQQLCFYSKIFSFQFVSCNIVLPQLALGTLKMGFELLSGLP